VSNSTGGDATTPNHHLKKASTEVWPDNSLSSFRISSQQARILVIPCLVVVPRRSFQSVSSSTLMSTCQSVQAPSVKFKRRHGPLLKPRLRFRNFFKVALLPNVNNMAYRAILTTGVQQLEDIFSIGRTNLRVWYDTMGLGANGARGERRRWRKCCNPGVLNFLKFQHPP